MPVKEDPYTTMGASGSRTPGLPSTPTRPKGWYLRRWLLGLLFVALLTACITETVIILGQSKVNKQIEAESKKELDTFMKKGNIGKEGKETRLLLKNVRFCWSKAVCVNTDRLTAQAFAMKNQGSSIIDFDSPDSFWLHVQNATVAISPTTLQGMFNESVFNYPGSTLRDLSVKIEGYGKEHHITLTGSLKYIFWIPFNMDTQMSINKTSNTLVMTVNSLHVFGFLPALWLIKFKPFNLQKLLPIPTNHHLTIQQNQIFIKPFGLFPPPRIDGQMGGIAITPGWVHLTFKGSNLAFFKPPEAAATNTILLDGGISQFGPVLVRDTRVQVVENPPQALFHFSLLNYWNRLPKSQIHMQSDHTLLVHMPPG